MPKVPRSPPTTNLAQSQSVNKANLVNKTDQANINANQRNLRPRIETSPGNDFHSFKQEFKQEIEEMLATWHVTHSNTITQMMEKQNTLLNKLVTEVSELKSQNSGIQKSFLEVEKSISFISSQYEDITRKVDNWEKERTQLTEFVKTLDYKTNDLQQCSRSASVEIRNVPAKEKESYDDLLTTVTNIGATIGKQLSSQDMRDLRRIPGKPGLIKPIVVEFAHVQTKQLFLDASRTYNKKRPNPDKLNTEHLRIPGERKPIYISEYLTGQTKKLFFITREFAKANSYDFCWTSNGYIYLRKAPGARQVLVKSEQTLKDLLKND